MNLKDRYCITKCQAKCCKSAKWNNELVSIRCPNLGHDNRCLIHDEWEDGICHFRFNFTLDGETCSAYGCGIKRALENEHLHPDVEKQCCYAHPELLEEL